MPASIGLPRGRAPAWTLASPAPAEPPPARVNRPRWRPADRLLITGLREPLPRPDLVLFPAPSSRWFPTGTVSAFLDGTPLPPVIAPMVYWYSGHEGSWARTGSD